MIYGSVCSGIEAATMAWHPLGWKASFFSEIEKFPRQVLAHHYPDTPLHGDFTTIQKDDYEPIELLVGGTPCQSFSVAGLRAGLNDPRGNLMLEFGALAKRLQPKWLVWENVPGVLSSNGGRDFGSFLAMLGELGYGFSYRVLDAQYFGVPQRRRRVFVIGHIGSWQRAAAVLFERDSLQGNPAPSRETRQKVASFTPSSFGQYSNGVGTLKKSGGDLGGGSETLLAWPAQTASTLNAAFGSKLGLENQHINSGAPLFVPAYGIPGNWINRKPENGGNAVEPMRDVSPCLTKMDQHAVAYGVGESPDLAHCLRSGASRADKHESSTYVQSQMKVRRLTPKECERLQGFHDNFTNIPGASDSARYKALGNSFAVPVVRWLGERIEKVERISRGES
jgi:DNA (cytosine-5)-methyltransferase 1